MYKLYWIKHPDHTDPYIEGYIGITKRNHLHRLSEHITRRPDVDFSGTTIEILHEGSKQEISDLEEKYRPHSYIGWNRSPGGLTGGRPTGIHTSGWKQSEEANAKRSESLKGSRNGQFGKTTSDKQKEAVSKALLGKSKTYKVRCNWKSMNGADNPKARSVIIDGLTYSTVTEASQKLGIHRTTITHRCKSKSFPNYE